MAGFLLGMGLALAAMALGIVAYESFLGLVHDNWEPVRLTLVLALPEPSPDEMSWWLLDLYPWVSLWLAGTSVLARKRKCCSFGHCE